jgi:hypothetical protein
MASIADRSITHDRPMCSPRSTPSANARVERVPSWRRGDDVACRFTRKR